MQQSQPKPVYLRATAFSISEGVFQYVMSPHVKTQAHCSRAGASPALAEPGSPRLRLKAQRSPTGAWQAGRGQPRF